jgi:anti-sigma factor RsiW
VTTTDTTQHPDVSEISDLTEGLLPPSRTADVRAHLDGCPLCADVRSSLEEIRGLLGTLPGPARMPADIAERIDAALAAEALLDATAPKEPDESVSRETTSAPAPAPAPASMHADRPAGRPTAATGPGRTRPAKRRRRTAVLGAAFGAAALGVGVLFFQAVQSGEDSSGAKTVDTAIKAPDEEAFSGTAVEDRVAALLNASEKSKAPRTDRQPPSVDRPSTMSTEKAGAVPPCVQAGTGRADQALASQTGTYEGKAAYLVVLPHPTDASQVQAYVLDASCTSRGTAKADVLLAHAYPRP